MNKQKIILIGIILLSVILAVVSYIVLPDEVIIQISTNGNKTGPKLVGILIPFCLTAVGVIISFLNLQDNGKINKGLIIAAIGIGIYILMLIINLLYTSFCIIYFNYKINLIGDDPYEKIFTILIR